MRPLTFDALPAIELYVYSPGVQMDMRLLGWWHELVETGDMETTYGGVGFVLSEFIRLVRGAHVWFTTDDSGRWTRVAWSTAVLGGADFGCWLAQDLRQSKESLAFVVAVLRELFDRVPVVLALTTDLRVVGDLKALGFSLLEEAIPGLFEGKAVSVLHLHRDTFLARMNPC